jgi:hypothetical protein
MKPKINGGFVQVESGQSRIRGWSMDAAEISSDSLTMRAGNGRGKVRLLTRQSLDGRTRARKSFDAIAEGIAADLGGSEELSTVQRHLIEAFAGCAIVLQALNARILLGQPVDIADQASAASTLVRLAARIGVERQAKDITPTLGDLIREDRRAQESENLESTEST